MTSPTRRRLIGAAGAMALLAWASVRAFALAEGRGSHDVTVLERIDLVDTARGRTIATRAYFPATPGCYPVILFSHGFGGDLSAFANTARAWASHGHVVIHPTHADSVRIPDTSAPPGRAAIRDIVAGIRRNGGGGGDRGALVRILEDPFYLASRIADIAFLVDLLETGKGIDPRLHARARRERLGMAGHSYGAYTTEALAGASLEPAGRNPPPALRGKFAAFMPISGQGSGRLGLAKHSFTTIVAPLFQVTGTRDIGAAGEIPEWRLEPYEASPPGRKYAALVRDFTHADFDPPLVDDPSVQGSKLRSLQVAFWKAWLDDDQAAQVRLTAAAADSKPGDPIWFRSR